MCVLPFCSTIRALRQRHLTRSDTARAYRTGDAFSGRFSQKAAHAPIVRTQSVCNNFDLPVSIRTRARSMHFAMRASPCLHRTQNTHTHSLSRRVTGPKTGPHRPDRRLFGWCAFRPRAHVAQRSLAGHIINVFVFGIARLAKRPAACTTRISIISQFLSGRRRWWNARVRGPVRLRRPETVLGSGGAERGPGVNKRPVLGGVNGHAFYICVRCSRLCSACARICVFVLSHKHTHAHIQCCRYVHNMSLRFVCCCPIGRARMRTARAQTCRILITCIKYDVAQNNARRGFVCNKRK